MGDDDVERLGKPRPAPELSDAVWARVKQVTSTLRELIRSPGAEIDNAESGRLIPPLTPPDPSGGDPANGAARARDPADNRPVPSVEDILREPGRYQPPPAHGHGPGRRR